ncbi:hypothetical protein AGLY_013091 [Aphis glycines]|uniref:Uncharacterized protein n=1 Tax=Aphis glycines TaxID=307491 RepID=A0A6G0T819_APHGL|nr:hypothetical protein AGLY_013091 [Aphis glycines]
MVKTSDAIHSDLQVTTYKNWLQNIKKLTIKNDQDTLNDYTFLLIANHSAIVCGQNLGHLYLSVCMHMLISFQKFSRINLISSIVTTGWQCTVTTAWGPRSSYNLLELPDKANPTASAIRLIKKMYGPLLIGFIHIKKYDDEILSFTEQCSPLVFKNKFKIYNNKKQYQLVQTFKYIKIQRYEWYDKND